jgi:simple sugar transport system ATP-binding protein
MTPPFITTYHISKHFEGVQALEDVSIMIHKGEIRCLAGENGSGKSTFIKILAGVHKPDIGEIIINGRPVSHLSPRASMRYGIQVIYQDFSLFPNLTIAENLAFNTLLERNRKIINWRQIKSIATEALERLDIGMDLDKVVEDVSVADKQLIAIARSLLHDVKLIIMDEPTSTLTWREVDVLFNIIHKLKENGVTILFVSHKLKEVLEISEQVTILRNGRKVAEGPTVDFDYRKLVYHMTGRALSESRYSFFGDQTEVPPLMQVKNLSMAPAFRDISFSLRPGEILGITGLMGSGRSELALALFGMRTVESGSIYLDGNAISIGSPQQAMAYGIAYVPEDRLTEGLFLEQSVKNNTIICIIKSMLRFLGLMNKSALSTEATKWLENLKVVVSSVDLPIHGLSGGNQQKVVLAKWLATGAKILILNGPTIGVDIGAKMDIHKKIRSLARQGIGIIIISDDASELIQTCNRLLIMHRGKFEQEIHTPDINENQLTDRLVTLK